MPYVFFFFFFLSFFLFLSHSTRNFELESLGLVQQPVHPGLRSLSCGISTILNMQLWPVRESCEILIEQFSAGSPPGRPQWHLSSGGPVVCIPLPIPSFLMLSPTSPSLASPDSMHLLPHMALLSNRLWSS